MGAMPVGCYKQMKEGVIMRLYTNPLLQNSNFSIRQNLNTNYIFRTPINIFMTPIDIQDTY